MKKVHLVTFADGGLGYLKGRDLLIKTAKESGWFETISSYDERRLAEDFPQWYNQHSHFIKTNRRGFGYWIWKPKIISSTLSKIPTGDIVLYLDAGCQVNAEGKARFGLYIDLAYRFEMLCFYLHGTNYTVGRWTKTDLLEHFSVKQDDPLLSLPQIESGICFYRNTTTNILHLRTWSETIESYDYHFVDDTESRKPEQKYFIEHRHDQAALTILHYKYRWGKSIRNENYFPIHWKHNLHPKVFPIAATRFINSNRTNLLALNLV